MSLWLDDLRNPPADGQDWTICRTVADAIRVMDAGRVERANILVVATLEPVRGKECGCACHKTGYDFVLWMAEHNRWPSTKPRVHSANPVGAAAMRQTIDRYWQEPR